MPLNVTVRRLGAVAAIVLALPATVRAGPAAVKLQPHRAIYDMSLLESAPNTNIDAATGRLVFEFTGSPCEGWTVNSRFVTRIDDLDGARRITDLRSSTYETAEADRLEFLNQTYVNETPQEEVKGTAERTDGTLQIHLTSPEPTELEIAASPEFPTSHVIALIKAAREGERLFQADLYDGADDGKTLYATTALIGPQSTVVDPGEGEAADVVALLGEHRTHWPVTLSYFNTKAPRGEITPAYELHFVLYDDGISRDLVLDYGNFKLQGALRELELLEAPVCE